MAGVQLTVRCLDIRHLALSETQYFWSGIYLVFLKAYVRMR